MLLQLHDGYIDLFPAVPDYWKNVEFDQFRTKEGVLISAQKSDGKVKNVNIKADVDIDIKMKLNLASYDFSGIAKKDISGDTDLVTITIKKGDVVNLVRK